MKAADATESSELMPPSLFTEWQKASKELESKRNLLASEKFFQSIAKRSDLTQLAPGKLYSRIIKEGKGRILHGEQGTLIIDCSITNQEGEGVSVLRGSDRYNSKLIELNDLLPSFVMAMQGMKEGEEREIFVHPALAYGESDNIEPNICLIARIKLVDITSLHCQEENISLPNLLTLSAENSSENELSANYEKLDHQLAFYLGAKTWAHYKKGMRFGYTLNDIIQSLDAFQRKEHIEMPSEEIDPLITSLHWKLYIHHD
jgi:peptidylprolyl isomerase/FKBP-type peptidyl-prolyl cis-trans isomerase FklB